MESKHVDFAKDNAMKCRCGECGVQAGKACPTEKMNALGGPAGIQSMQEMPGAAETPLVYCSQGVSGCDDLDFSQTCICPTCAVWQGHGLANYKYCRDGNAEKIG